MNQAGSMSPPLLSPLARTAKTIGSVFSHTIVATANVPTYGSPWGLVLGSDKPLNQQPNPAIVDEHIKRSTNNRMRMFDGTTLLGLLQTPKHVRDKIDEETVIYSLEKPPQISR